MLKRDILWNKVQQNTLLRPTVISKSAFLLKLCFFLEMGHFYCVFFLLKPAGRTATTSVDMNSLGTETEIKTASSTGVAPTSSVRDTQFINRDRVEDMNLQRELGRQDAIRTAANLKTENWTHPPSEAPSQVAVTTTSAVMGGIESIEGEVEEIT